MEAEMRVVAPHQIPIRAGFGAVAVGADRRADELDADDRAALILEIGLQIARPGV
jgi:hypothetical protein